MRIEREVINKFKAWKDTPNRKPIQGLRLRLQSAS